MRVFNFNPGPAALPLEVLQQAQLELIDYKGTGLSILESSHRSPEYEEINNAAMALVREVMGLGDDYHVLFLTGGASTQFAMIPLNFLPDGKTAAYVDTGSWSTKAIKEAKRVGNVHLAGAGKEKNYSFIPSVDSLDIPADAAYVHLTSNNTIAGTEWHNFPDTGSIPLVCDMSSDICSRQMDFRRFALIYAGAQKNIGPAGVTLVVLRDDMLARCKEGNFTMLDYRTHAEKKSLFNTPPVFAVYMVRLVFEWMKKQGGLEEIERINSAKQERVYQMIDLYPDFYRGTVETNSRSWMNITFRLPSEELEAKFLAEAKAAGMIGLKGHRSVGGIRVSLYNAVPLKAADRIAGFMDEFRKKNG